MHGLMRAIGLKYISTKKALEEVLEEVIDTAASGALVPNATIVKPITRSLTPHFFATAAEPSVRQLAPIRINANPPMRNRMSRMISIIVVK